MSLTEDRNAYSFCGAWHTGSKLVLIAVMLRGRHRGLPVAIDKAVMLPHETLAWAEEEDAQMRREATQGTSGAIRRRLTGLDAWEGNSGKTSGTANVNANASGRSPEQTSGDRDVEKIA